MEQNKVKFPISLPIAAVAVIATLSPVSGVAQGSNAWNTNTNTLNSASSAPVMAPQEKPKYYVEPSVKTPHTIAPDSAPVAADNRFAPDNLEELLATGRNTNPAAPARPAYPQMQPQQQLGQPQQQAFAPTNMGQPRSVQTPTQNSTAYPQYRQGYGQPYGQQNGQNYNQPYGQQYGSNGFGPYSNNGFPGGFNSFPGGFNNFPGNGYGGFPSVGGFPGFGSPSTNFSPFGFW